ncbi:MAG TPA: GNAT family N-acetyltransferase [Gemmatimonadaceae bacterium]|nr:GNAT family N-acetyltransferase [Gemmatimonadaceae bacterium]
MPNGRQLTAGHPFGALYRDVTRAWRDGGAPAAWLELREWIVFPVARHGRLLLIEQQLESVPAVPTVAGVRIARFEGTDWRTLAPIANERTLRRFQRAGARGRLCLVAWRDAIPVGCTWLSARTDWDLEQFVLDLPRDTSYGWNTFVSPKERGAGVGSALMHARLTHSRDLGYRASWGLVDPENRASLRTIEKISSAQTRVVAELRYVKVLRWFRARAADVTSASPRA